MRFNSLDQKLALLH